MRYINLLFTFLWHDIAFFVLKVPLNTNQPTFTFFYCAQRANERVNTYLGKPSGIG